MRFLVIYKNEFSGITYHRLTVPFRHLEKQGHKVTWIKNFEEKQTIECSDYDFLVFNRSMGHGFQDIQIIKDFQDRGVKVIMDIDDYWNLPDNHTIVWRKDVPYDIWRSTILNNMAAVDGIWTSTTWLYHKIQELHPDKPLRLAKNCIDWNEEQWSDQNKTQSKRVRFGWLGSTTHHRDLDQLRRPMKHLMKDPFMKKNINVRLYGYEDSTEHGREVWGQFFKALSNENNKLLGSVITAHRGVRVNEYARLYQDVDVSIAPVIDNDVNRGKSELKILEAGVKSIPFIGSDVGCYNRTDANVDLCSGPQDWIDAIKDLTKYQDLRKELGEELHDYVRANYIIEHENEKRLSIIS